MAKSKRGKRRPGEKAAADSAPDAGDALYAELHAQPEFHQAVEGKECPASKVEDEAPSPSTERRDQLRLENWEQLPRLLVWFAIGAAADSTAKLSFPPTLSKEQRAQIHSAAEALKSIESVSDGAADERFVAVVAKGAAQKRELSAAQEEEALVLWKLAKEAGFSASRDEVRQQLADGTLSGELATLWNGKGRSQQEAVRRLSTAASNGDVAEMKEIMSSHPDVVKDGVSDLSNGSATPLHVAAAEGQLAAVKALLEAGADVSAVNARGQTALQVAQAAEECDVEAVLIQAGAKDTKPDGFSTLNASAPVFVPAAFTAAANTSTVAAPATAAPVIAASASSAQTTSSAANGTEQASQQDAPVLDTEPAEQSQQDGLAAEDGITMPEGTQHQLQKQEEPVEQQGQEEDEGEEATTAAQLPVEQPKADEQLPKAEEQQPEATEQQPEDNQLGEAEKPEEAKAEQQEPAQQPGEAEHEQQQEPVEQEQQQQQQQQQQQPADQEQEAEQQQQQESVEQEVVTEQQHEAQQQAEAVESAMAPKQPEGSLPEPTGADRADEEAAPPTQQAAEAATSAAAEAEDGAVVTAAAAAPAPAMPTDDTAAAAAPDTGATASTADGSHSVHKTTAPSAAASAAPASTATVSCPAVNTAPTSPAVKETVAPKPQQATGSLSRQSSSTVHPLAYAWTPGAATLAQGTTSSKKLFGTIAGGDAPLPAAAAESAPFGSGSSMPAFGSAAPTPAAAAPAAASSFAGTSLEPAVDSAADGSTAKPPNSFAAAAAAGGVVVQGDTDATSTRLSGITIAGGAAPKEQSASATILPPPAADSQVDAGENGESGTLLSVTPPLEDRRPGTSEITPVATANGTAGIRAGPGAADATDSRAAAEGPGASAAERFADKEPWYLQPISAGSSVTWAAAGGVAACVVAGAAALLLLRRRRR